MIQIGVYVIALVLATLSLAQDVSRGDSNTDVDALIAQLGDEDWQTRQAAQERLVLMGRAVQAQLEAAARNSADAEVRSLAEEALALIADNVETGASMITIRGSDLPLRDVVKQLSEQSGAALEVYPPDLLEQQRDMTVTLDIDHLPFWEAMQQINRETGLVLQQWDHTGVRLMHGGSAIDGISHFSGAFKISAVRISLARALTPGGAAHVHEDFQVQLSAQAEPKLRVLRASFLPNILEAVDEHGNSLLPADHHQMVGSAMAPSGVWQAPVRLARPPGAGTRIARLRGSFDVTLQTGHEQIEIADIASARSVEKLAGGVRFIIKELRRNGETFGVDIIARPAGAASQEWERMRELFAVTDIRLLDEQGESFQRTGHSSSGGQDQVQISIEFSARTWGRNSRKLGEPSKLVWTVPTATKDLSVPFEFRDLPIP